MDADGLVRAIRAALDETERIATWAAEEVGDGHWQQRNVRIVTVRDRDREVADFVAGVELIDHITHNDPAAVLRRVAADREILAEHPPERRRVTFTDDEGSTNWGEFVCVTCYSPEVHRDFDPSFPCPTVRALARGLGINPETEIPQ